MSIAQSLLSVSVSLYHKEGTQSFRCKCGKMSNKKLVFNKCRILHLQIFLPFSNGHWIKVLCNIFLRGLLVPVIMSDLTLSTKNIVWTITGEHSAILTKNQLCFTIKYFLIFTSKVTKFIHFSPWIKKRMDDFKTKGQNIFNKLIWPVNYQSTYRYY